MRKMLTCMSAALILSVFLIPGSVCCADAQKNVPASKMQPLTQSRKSPANMISEKKVDKINNKLPSTGVGKRVIVNANFKIEGIDGNIPSGIKENNDKLITGENHSVIVINGWIDMGDMQYIGARPRFQMPHLAFADAPKTCRIVNTMLPQLKSYVMRYRYAYVFEDTATKPECWSYFMKLERLRVEIQKVKVTINSPWEQGQELPIAGGGMMDFHLSTIRMKNPGGD